MFAKTLEDDLSWREGELAVLKSLFAGTSPSSLRRRSLRRAFLAMLYAHYEGFTKFAFESYLIEISRKKIEYIQLKPALQCRFLLTDMQEVRNAQAFQFSLKAAEYFKKLSSPLSNPYATLETSNLWPNIFQDFCKGHAVSDAIIEPYWFEVKQLVARRNDIAHGKNVEIDDVALTKLENATMNVCIALAIELDDCVQARLYLGP
jgi:MAE_28990/MAE_18760-like HEPN